MEFDTSAGGECRLPVASDDRGPGRLLQAFGLGAESDGFLKASWDRCRNDYGLLPDTAHEAPSASRGALGQRQEELHRLLRIARMEMNSFYAQIAEPRNTLVLTDADGLVLEQVGDSRQNRQFRARGLAPGFIWDERHVGTNGPGTCLFEQRPVTIYRDEHFFRDFSDLSCSAAPIWGPDGRLLAVLDASSFDCTDSRQSQLHTLLLVSMSARVIEQIYFANSFQDSWIVRFHSRAELVGMVHDAMLAVDADGRVCGADSLAAGLLRRESPSELIGRSVSEVFDLSPARFFANARSMPCRIWATQGHAPGSRQFLSVRAPHRPASVNVGWADPTAPAARMAGDPAATGRCPVEGERDPVMAYNIWCAEQVMNKGINILLQGATGTGKGTLAKAIHMRSDRSKKPFIAMCCAAIPETLAESELFGYEAGAFTGARSGGMRGKIAASHGGTLFLDEIGDMPLSLQARLLHVLEEKEVTPLGSTRPIAVDLHVISASNHNLLELIEQGKFREDLYYRLNGVTLTLPPLRERQDLVELIDTVIRSENGDRPALVDPPAMDCLLAYGWPGNVRELRNVVRTALALSPDGTLHLEQLPWTLRSAANAVPPRSADGGMRSALHVAGLDDAEPGEADTDADSREEMVALLQRHRWNVSHAAESLAVSRNTLYRRMHRLGILTPRAK